MNLSFFQSGGTSVGNCPSNQITDGCPPNSYICLTGPAEKGCNNDPNYWKNNSACHTYCYKPPGTQPGQQPQNGDRGGVSNRKTRNIKITNNHNQTIWIGIYGLNSTPANGGFELASNQSQTITVPSNWTSGRIWARTGCIGHIHDNSLVCETGDCNGKFHCQVTGTPPASLAEFTLSPNGSDYYDISLVDGYNLPIQIIPTKGTYQNVEGNLGSLLKPSSSNGKNELKGAMGGLPPKFNCGAPKCLQFDMNQCPPELLMQGRNSTACSSICTAVNNPHKVKNASHIQNFNKALVCCSCDCGPNCGCDSPQCKYGCSPLDKDPSHRGGRCDLNQWPKASNGATYSGVFKKQCPDAYSWQFDDVSSTYQCRNGDYEVIFGAPSR